MGIQSSRQRPRRQRVCPHVPFHIWTTPSRRLVGTHRFSPVLDLALSPCECKCLSPAKMGEGSADPRIVGARWRHSGQFGPARNIWRGWRTRGGAGFRPRPRCAPRSCEQTPPATSRSTPESSVSALSAFGTVFSEKHTEESEYYETRWSIAPKVVNYADRSTNSKSQASNGHDPEGTPARALPPRALPFRQSARGKPTACGH